MPSDTKLRILQVGCGGRARAHIAAMQACGAVELLALCDLDEERLNAAGEQFGIERRYRDMAEAIRAEQPDLVDIVTPPTIRASIIEPAIEAGARALLIEKPLALTPSEFAPARRAGARPADRGEHAVPVDAALAALLWPAGAGRAGRRAAAARQHALQYPGARATYHRPSTDRRCARRPTRAGVGASRLRWPGALWANAGTRRYQRYDWAGRCATAPQRRPIRARGARRARDLVPAAG